MRRTIPKRTFQAIALLTLLVPLGIWLFWILRSSGPLPWLRDALAFLGEREGRLLASVVAFFPPFAGWLLIILPLRSRSQLPTARDEMERLGAGSHWELFTRSLEEEKRERSEMIARPAGDPSRRRYFRKLGLISFILGSSLLLATGGLFYLTESMWLWGLVGGLVGLLGGLASLLTGRPSIFDEERVGRLDRTVKLALALVVLLALLILPLLCVLDALAVTFP